MSEEDDAARFRQVVVPHLADALTLARWISGNRADAEDILQDACLRAFRGIGGYAGGSARAWVLTVVRRTAYTWLGKNRTTMLVSVNDLGAGEFAKADEGFDAADMTSPTPEAELIAKADADRLKAAIDALPLEFRETLVMRDIQGLDYREIADVLGTPIGTVMSRLARARRRLIAALGNDQT